MKKTVTLLMGIAEIEVEFNYTPAQLASDPDGRGGPPLQPPTEEEFEVLSVSLKNGDDLKEEIQNHWTDELRESL